MTPDTLLIFLSNLALVIVTAAAVYASFREGHRHEEAESVDTERDEERLAHIAELAVQKEHELAASSK